MTQSSGRRFQGIRDDIRLTIQVEAIKD